MAVKKAVLAAVGALLLTGCGADNTKSTGIVEVGSVECIIFGFAKNCDVTLTDGRTFINGGHSVEYLRKGNKVTIEYVGLNSIRNVQFSEEESQ